MDEPVHVTVKKWLEDVIENSEKAVDKGWTVERSPEDETVMLIDSDQTPFRITVVAGEDITYMAFVTGLELADTNPSDVAPALREMLVKNREVDFVKFCLMEPKDTVMLRTDLYSRFMDKDEFNTALEYLILLGRWFIAELNKAGKQDEQVKELERLSAAALLQGTDPGEVRTNLVRAGVPEMMAEQMVAGLVDLLGIKTGETSAGGVEGAGVAEVPAQKKVAKRNSAVDNYIW